MGRNIRNFSVNNKHLLLSFEELYADGVTTTSGITEIIDVENIGKEPSPAVKRLKGGYRYGALLSSGCIFTLELEETKVKSDKKTYFNTDKVLSKYKAHIFDMATLQEISKLDALPNKDQEIITSDFCEEQQIAALVTLDRSLILIDCSQNSCKLIYSGQIEGQGAIMSLQIVGSCLSLVLSAHYVVYISLSHKIDMPPLIKLDKKSYAEGGLEVFYYPKLQFPSSLVYMHWIKLREAIFCIGDQDITLINIAAKAVESSLKENGITK